MTPGPKPPPDGGTGPNLIRPQTRSSAFRCAPKQPQNFGRICLANRSQGNVTGLPHPPPKGHACLIKMRQHAAFGPPPWQGGSMPRIESKGKWLYTGCSSCYRDFYISKSHASYNSYKKLRAQNRTYDCVRVRAYLVDFSYGLLPPCFRHGDGESQSALPRRIDAAHRVLRQMAVHRMFQLLS